MRSRGSFQSLSSVFALLLVAGCATMLESDVQPEVTALDRYDYPYEGLQVGLDPKGYNEFQYRIFPVDGRDPHLAVVSEGWLPARKALTVDLKPRAHLEWTLQLLFRHADGETARIERKVELGVPPWHALEQPLQFTVKAEYRCVWSERLSHMGQVKTLVGYKLSILELPRELDRTLFIGFSATAPRIKPKLVGTENAIVSGSGRGRITALDKDLNFAGNYQINVDPYPHCQDLNGMEIVSWKDLRIRLIDKFEFPVEATLGEVVSSVRGIGGHIPQPFPPMQRSEGEANKAN